MGDVGKEMGVWGGVLGGWVKVEGEGGGGWDGMSEGDVGGENGGVGGELGEGKMDKEFL